MSNKKDPGYEYHKARMRNTIVAIYLPPATKKRLRQLKHKLGRSVSEICREALEKAMEVVVRDADTEVTE